MITGIVSNWTSVVGTDVPFVTTLKTNGKVTNNNGLFNVWRSGLYDIDANLVITGIAGEVIASIYADGSETGTYAEVTLTDASDFATIPLMDAIRVVAAEYPDVASISIRLDTAGLTTNGNIRIQSLT